MMSEWPFRNLVAEVMLMSAPRARGCWKVGAMMLLSTTTSAPTYTTSHVTYNSLSTVFQLFFDWLPPNFDWLFYSKGRSCLGLRLLPSDICAPT